MHIYIFHSLCSEPPQRGTATFGSLENIDKTSNKPDDDDNNTNLENRKSSTASTKPRAPSLLAAPSRESVTNQTRTRRSLDSLLLPITSNNNNNLDRSSGRHIAGDLAPSLQSIPFNSQQESRNARSRRRQVGSRTTIAADSNTRITKMLDTILAAVSVV